MFQTCRLVPTADTQQNLNANTILLILLMVILGVLVAYCCYCYGIVMATMPM